MADDDYVDLIRFMFDPRLAEGDDYDGRAVSLLTENDDDILDRSTLICGVAEALSQEGFDDFLTSPTVWEGFDQDLPFAISHVTIAVRCPENYDKVDRAASETGTDQ